MAGSGSKAAAFMEAGENKGDDILTRESIRTAQEVGSSQTPVEAIEAKVLGEPVLELVPALMGKRSTTQPSRVGESRLQTLSRFWM